MTTRVSDYIISRLYDAGVHHLFIVTGRGNLYLSDAVARHKDIKSVAVHHEQSSAFAAVAYAQYNGTLGACLVSTGCASTNAITPILGAWQDDVPCVVISGQNWLRETSRHTGIPLRTYGQQEADVIRIVEPITKYAVMINDAKRIGYEMDKALRLATTGRKGPVWIDVPLDIQGQVVDPETLERETPEATPPLAPTTDDIAWVLEQMRSAKRPVVMIGSGVRSAGAIAKLQALLKKSPVPVTFAASATDAIGAAEPLSIGTVGSIGGTRAGNFAVQNSDVLLVIGCRLSPVTTGPDYQNFARGAKICVVDIDKVEHSKKTVRIDRLIHSDAGEFLDALLATSLPVCDPEWIKRCAHWKKRFPVAGVGASTRDKVDLYQLAETFNRTLASDAVVVTDSGLEELIIPGSVSFREGQRCIHPNSQGSMGYALPAAIGAQFASGKQTVAVIGDGSIMMNLQELQTVRHHKLPVKIFVINNNVYAIIRKRQVDLFRSRTIGTDPSNGVTVPDWADVARCFGLGYVRVNDATNLDKEIGDVLGMSGPVLCEIMGLDDQDYLRSSYAFNSKKRMVQRPLEDQAPFLDRAVLTEEMVIDPLD